MGLFNLKKSKTKDDELEASDAWLMGLAGDDDLTDGPNANIPTGLASLAPIDDAFDAGLQPEYDAETQSLLDSDNVDLSSWHFPDLADDTSSSMSTEPSTPAAASQSALSPYSEASGADQADSLFDNRHPGTQTFDPFGADALVHEGILDEDDTPQPHDNAASNGHNEQLSARTSSLNERAIIDAEFMESSSANEGMGFSSKLFASALDEAIDDTTIDDTVIDEAIIDEAIIDDAIINTREVGIPATAVAPRGREADLLCEILGVEPGATWTELRAAHAAAMSEYDPRLESDEDRIALAWAIRREMNSTYATLRLLSAA